MELELIKEIEVNMEQIGPQGYSAYEVYVKNGGTLSETEWLASLKGDAGEKGDKGDTGSVKFIVVTELPTENIETDAIYIKPVQDPQEQNTYEEFIYVNNAWESLGTPKVEVDLSNYPTKDEVKEITGELTDLSTEDKTNLVNAINEAMESGGDSSIPIVDIKNNSMITQNYIFSSSDEKLQMSAAVRKATENGTKIGTILIVANEEISLMRIGLSGTSNNRPKYSFFAYGARKYKYSDSRVYFYDGNIVLNTDFTFYEARRQNLSYIVEKDDVLTKTNNISYTPTSNYHPATKKYVDDAIASAITTSLEASY